MSRLTVAAGMASRAAAAGVVAAGAVAGVLALVGPATATAPVTAPVSAPAGAPPVSLTVSLAATGTAGTAGTDGTLRATPTGPAGRSPGRSATGSPAGSPTPTPSPSPRPTAHPSAQDAAFLRAAHQDNLAEIQAGTAAEHRGTSGTLRSLGTAMVREHTSLDADLQRIATRLSLEMPTAPTGTRQRQLDEISVQTGKAFDRAWVAAVTGWNTQALSDDQGESRSGTLDDVKGLARDSVSVVHDHLSRLARVPVEGSQMPTPTRTNTDDYAASQSPLVISVAAGMIIVGAILLVLTARAAMSRHRRELPDGPAST